MSQTALAATWSYTGPSPNKCDGMYALHFYDQGKDRYVRIHSTNDSFGTSWKYNVKHKLVFSFDKKAFVYNLSGMVTNFGTITIFKLRAGDSVDNLNGERVPSDNSLTYRAANSTTLYLTQVNAADIVFRDSKDNYRDEWFEGDKSFVNILHGMMPLLLVDAEETAKPNVRYNMESNLTQARLSQVNKANSGESSNVPITGYGSDGRAYGWTQLKVWLKAIAENNKDFSKSSMDSVLRSINRGDQYSRLANYWDSVETDEDKEDCLTYLYYMITKGSGYSASDDETSDADDTNAHRQDKGQIAGLDSTLWNQWYVTAYKVAAQSSDWSELEKASVLGSYDIPQEKTGAYWRRVYDVLSVAYSHGDNNPAVQAWDPNKEMLLKAYANTRRTGNGAGLDPNGVTRYRALLDKLNSVESNKPTNAIRRMSTFYDRITALYHVSTLRDVDGSDESYSWIQKYYSQDNDSTIIPSEIFQDTSSNLLVFSGSIYKDYPQLGDSSSDISALTLPYILSTAWELPYIRDYMCADMNEAIKNSTILQRKELYQALTDIKRAVDETGIPVLSQLWESETKKEEYSDLSYKSLKAMWEACERDPNVKASKEDLPKEDLSTGKPLSSFMDYEQGVISDYYKQGIAYTSTLVPMRSNVYSSEWLSYLDSEFVDKFYRMWGFNRKAIMIDKTSGAAESYFTTNKSSKGEVKVCTLRDLLNVKDDVVLYLDDNFYNSSSLQEAMDKSVHSYNQSTDTEGNTHKWWSDVAEDLEITYNTDFNNIVKTGDSLDYSEVYYEMISSIDSAHTYYPDATSDNPGNKDNVVLSSGKINYYLKADQIGSKTYSPLQGYAVVSSVYRDGDLFGQTRAISKRQPVFIASKGAAYMNGATLEAKQTLLNYALLRNIESNMPVGYTGNLDMDCPLYMDILGNILTESGTVVIPAASNATIMSHDSYYNSMWSAGFFAVYGTDYKIPVNKHKSGKLKDILDPTFVEDSTGKYYLPKARTLGDDYRIDMSKLATSSKDTLDILYQRTYSDIVNADSGADKAYDFDSYFQICMEVLRGAPIENIDKVAENLDTTGRLDRAGIVASAKLEELNKSLKSAGDNTLLALPNLAFMPGFNYIALLSFKILTLVVIAVWMFTIYKDTVSAQLSIGTLGKCLSALFLTVAAVVIVPRMFNVTYYHSNQALLQKESTRISMLNLEKEESGVEIGVTEIAEPDVSTKLFLKLEDINIPWYELFYNCMLTNTYKAFNEMYADYAQNHAVLANYQDVQVKNDGVYVDINDVYKSSSVDLDYSTDDINTRRLEQTASQRSNVFSFYSPYYAILDALIRNVNYYNANPWNVTENAEDIQGWYSYTTKVQKGGRVKTMGLISPYFTSPEFLELEGKDITGLRHIYFGLADDNYIPDVALDNLYTENNLSAMRSSYWYAEDVDPSEANKRLQYMEKEARNFVYENKELIGKISDETFLKVMAMHLALQHNKAFNLPKASALEIYNMSTDDLVRMSVTDTKEVMLNSTLSYPRYIYTVGGTPAVYAAALLSMVNWICGIAKPVLVQASFVIIFVSIFIFCVCLRKSDTSVFGYIITTVILSATNILYSVLLKLSMWLPELGLTPFMCLLFLCAIQILYIIVLVEVVWLILKDWRDLAFSRYVHKADTVWRRLLNVIFRKRNSGQNPYYGGSTAKSTPEKNWRYYEKLTEDTMRRYTDG